MVGVTVVVGLVVVDLLVFGNNVDRFGNGIGGGNLSRLCRLGVMMITVLTTKLF